MVESSEAAIRSIELQLVRVETCGKSGPAAACSRRLMCCGWNRGRQAS